MAGYIHGADYICTYADPLRTYWPWQWTRPGGAGASAVVVGTLEDWARACGCARVAVFGADRQGAHRFYAACGYILRKEQKSFFKRLGVAP